MIRSTAGLAALWLAIGIASAGSSAVQAPVVDVEAQLAFLQTARVVSTRPIGKGITGALRVTLSDGQITHDAAFQRVQEETSNADRARQRRRGGELNFVDHYRYNIAAWRLARLVGLGHMMPATVERRIRAESGALAWWVDDVLMDEEEREATKAEPPGGSLPLARQQQTMLVFAELVRDTDRNKGNVLYTKDWRLIMLDFTRAFRLQESLRAPNTLTGCGRDLFARLRALTALAIKGAVEHYLTSGEIAAMMARRDLVVRRFDQLIAERGEAAVLY